MIKDHKEHEHIVKVRDIIEYIMQTDIKQLEEVGKDFSDMFEGLLIVLIVFIGVIFLYMIFGKN